MSTQPNPRVAESKKLASLIFYPANLNLEKEKISPLLLPWTWQAETQETDMVRTLTSCWLLSRVQDFLAASSVQPVKLTCPSHLTIGEEDNSSTL